MLQLPLQDKTLCKEGCYGEGRAAYFDGVALGENPYCPGLQLDYHEAWSDGWLDAETFSMS